MSSVDNRIVNMQFNNSQFNSGISSTMSLLDKLKEKLNLPGSKPKVDMSGVDNSVTQTSSKFSALETIATGALLRIGSAAADLGTKLLKSLTIQPAIDGFQEYEMQINSLRTIAANLPNETNENINATLDRLNTYADQTIYNFGDMTRAMGLFSAAGVDLARSEKAITGLSNIAAGSGATNEALSRAEYQVSQALQQGYFQLMDWRSLENAGLASPEFRENIKQTARDFGVDVDSMIKTYGSFQASLSKEKWLTSDIFLATLEKAQKGASDWGDRLYEAATKISTASQLFSTIGEEIGSGWGQSFKTIFGDLYEARDLFTGIYNELDPIIGKISDFRNNILKFWDENGGRMALFDTQSGALFNVLKAFSDVAHNIGQAFTDVFGGFTTNGKKLTDFSNRLKDITASFELFIGGHGSEIKNTFSGIFSVFDMAGDVLGSFWKNIKRIGRAILPTGDQFLTLTGDIGQFLTELDKSGTFTEKFDFVLSRITTGIVNFIKGFKDGIKAIAEGAQESYKVQSIIEKITTLFQNLKKVLANLPDIISGILSHIGDFGRGIGEGFGGFLSSLQQAGSSEFLDNLSVFAKNLANLGKALATWFMGGVSFDNFVGFVNTVLGLLGSGAIVSSLNSFKDTLKGFSDAIGAVKDAAKSVPKILDAVKDSLVAYQRSIQADTLLKIAAAVGILAGSFTVLAMLDSDKVANGLVAIAGALGTFLGALYFMSKIKLTKSDGLDGGLLGKLFGPLSDQSSMATIFIKMAVAVGILAVAMKTLGSMSWDEIGRGLTAIGGLMTELTIVSKIFSGMEDTSKGAAAMMTMAGAIGMLVGPLKVIGGMDWESIGKGLTGVGALLGELAVFSVITQNVPNMTGLGVGLLLVAAGVTVLTNAINTLGSMDTGALYQGLSGIGWILIEVGAAFEVLADKSKQAVVAAAAIAIVSGALVVLSLVVQSLGNMDTGALAQGLIGLGVSLGLVTAALLILGSAGPAGIAGAAGLMIASAALLAMAGAIATVAALPTEGVATALAAFAAGLVILLGAAALATPLIPGLLALAAACVGIGAGCLMAGAGVLMFATGLTMLGVVIGAVVSVVVGVLSTIVNAIGSFIASIAAFLSQPLPDIGAIIMDAFAGVADFFTNLITSIGETLGLIGEVIATYGPAILQAIANLLSSILSGVVGWITGTLVPGIITGLQAMLTFFGTLGSVILQGVVTLVSAAGNLIIGFITGLASGLASLVTMGAQAVAGFVGGILGAIGSVIAAGVSAAVGFISGLVSAIGGAIASGVQAAANFVSGILSAIGQAISAGVQAVSNFISGIASNLGSIVAQGAQAVANFISGIASNLGSIISQGASAVQNFLSGVRNNIGGLVSAGADMIHGLIKGIQGAIGGLVSAAANAAKSALDAAKRALGINSPSKEFAKLGEFSDEGMAIGFNKKSKLVADAAGDAAAEALSAVASMMENIDNDYSPTITPVLDLSNIQNGSRQINSWLGSGYGIGLNPLLGSVSPSATSSADLNYQISQLRNDLKTYTDAVIARPQYSWKMGDAVINDDSRIREDFLDIIGELNRRAGMNVG